ncbi:hypothetical protein LPB136_00145 [Tenacibaculum todarodis]|uniref:Secretion system C-terminal sorting domain-containing protein n=1 Tax=Tenacibaculum todarodis TaxID=1850252 RepID=A0A1L3JFH8_9FLAO|nr:T9SS type A sorting domain-containing protein [Tenacibaculum todarodis]APG63874.1 hypothetical protein LPB136_00145 [Tenacibaculum todarodis]
MKQKYFLKTLLVASLFLGIQNSWGQLSITTADTDFTIDFDSTVADVNNGQFIASGLDASPASGQLDSDAWTITGFSSAADLTRGENDGGVSTGGLYAFDISNGGTKNNAIGIQPGGSDFTPGTITLKIDNNTGAAVIETNISYNIWILNNAPRGNSFNFSYSTDNSTYTEVAAMDFTSTGDAIPEASWEQIGRFKNISGLNIPDGGSLYIRWTGDDEVGSSSRDEFALDDIIVKMSGSVLDTDSFNKLDVNVYPNPVTNGEVFIKSSNGEEKNVEVYNILGRRLISTKVNANDRVDVSNLNAGIYLLKVNEGDKQLTKKIVIK